MGQEQWRINDSAFLACDGSVGYDLKKQSFGRAIFGGTGGFFVMETKGSGTMLLNAYGDLFEIVLDGSKPFIADNTHVVAWSNTLSYDLKIASGTFGFTSGEGIVNEFRGVGRVILQSRNVQSLAEMVQPYIVTGK
ncbi:MAG: AIM24 family protein [Suipraeoptans sp.]